MSLVHLASACSHLQNASRARLGLTSIPCTTMLHTLLLCLQRSGYISNVAIGGPLPPAPNAVNPTFSPLHIDSDASAWSTTHVPDEGDEDAIAMVRKAESEMEVRPNTMRPSMFVGRGKIGEEGGMGKGKEAREEVLAYGPRPAITRANVASRRLWVGLKYWNNEPVLRRMSLVSKPTRRVWMGVPELMELTGGNQKGYVKGLRGIGESLYVTTDRGILEVRECVERKVGGMLLCRVNPY